MMTFTKLNCLVFIYIPAREKNFYLVFYTNYKLLYNLFIYLLAFSVLFDKQTNHHGLSTTKKNLASHRRNIQCPNINMRFPSHCFPNVTNYSEVTEIG